MPFTLSNLTNRELLHAVASSSETLKADGVAALLANRLDSTVEALDSANVLTSRLDSMGLTPSTAGQLIDLLGAHGLLEPAELRARLAAD